MKKILIIVILILSKPVFGQIPGKAIEGPIILFDTLTVKQGDVLFLGKGSDPDTGNFIHLYIPKNKLANTLYNVFSNNDDLSHKAIPQRKLDKEFANKQLVIEGFSKISSKKKGKRILGVINMKDYQFIEGIYFNNVAVDFEPAIKSGEIIKISAAKLEEKVPEVDLLRTPFEMTINGTEPVVAAINNLSKIELYNMTLDWANSYYIIPNRAAITVVQDEKININSIAKNIQFGKIMGMDFFSDMPYMFVVDITNGEIEMTFMLGDKNGDILDENGEIIANISPSHMFNNKGEVLKMSKTLKIETEKVMNDLSKALVDYLMK